MFGREEMSRYIEVQSAVRESRTVGDCALVQLSVADKLSESLESVEYSGGSGSRYFDAVFTDIHSVSLVGIHAAGYDTRT